MSDAIQAMPPDASGGLGVDHFLSQRPMGDGRAFEKAAVGADVGQGYGDFMTSFAQTMLMQMFQESRKIQQRAEQLNKDLLNDSN